MVVKPFRATGQRAPPPPPGDLGLEIWVVGSIEHREHKNDYQQMDGAFVV
jgi:hypothetical protein